MLDIVLLNHFANLFTFDFLTELLESVVDIFFGDCVRAISVKLTENGTQFAIIQESLDVDRG